MFTVPPDRANPGQLVCSDSGIGPSEQHRIAEAPTQAHSDDGRDRHQYRTARLGGKQGGKAGQSVADLVPLPVKDERTVAVGDAARCAHPHKSIPLSSRRTAERIRSAKVAPDPTISRLD